jgi:hypothetical protein
MRKVHIMTYMVIFTCSATFISCAGDKTKTINPNGDSELALLMRDMHEDGLHTRQLILEGKEPEVRVKYHQLQSAKATEPEKAASQAYKSFAAYYEATVKSLLESNEANRAESYQTMVDACMSCHQELCPGPMRKIKRLYLSDAEIASLSAE